VAQGGPLACPQSPIRSLVGSEAHGRLRTALRSPGGHLQCSSPNAESGQGRGHPESTVPSAAIDSTDDRVPATVDLPRQRSSYRVPPSNWPVTWREKWAWNANWVWVHSVIAKAAFLLALTVVWKLSYARVGAFCQTLGEKFGLTCTAKRHGLADMQLIQHSAGGSDRRPWAEAEWAVMRHVFCDSLSSMLLDDRTTYSRSSWNKHRVG
jgi:hypothetical protein